MSDINSKEVNNTKQSTDNTQQDIKHADNATVLKKLISLKPESYGTIRMVSSQTYKSNIEGPNEW